jgi:PAS domain S-box-containing protein/diguanylate cyclase (GGDEF)-like protein
MQTLKDELSMQKNNVLSLSSNNILKRYLKDKKDDLNIKDLFEQTTDSHKTIMQLRYINESGKESIRFERKFLGDIYRKVPNNALQDKSDRYYFKEVKVLNEGEIWISDIDLNIENGKIQVPFVPTLRVATPVYLNQEFKGIVIINLFMDKILDKITQNDLFMISLVDKDGYILVGSQNIENKLFDFSWSRYLKNNIDIKKFLPEYINDILSSYKFNSDYVYSHKISKDLKLQQNLFLVLSIKQDVIDKLKETTIDDLTHTLTIVLLLSGPLGLILALIPSLLADRINKTKTELNNKTKLFDEYLEAMNINNIVSKADLKGNIIYVNKNFCDVTGFKEEEVLGKPHSIVRHPSSKSETFKILWLTIQSGKIWKGILRNKKKDGGYYDVDIAIVPIKDSYGKIIEYFAIRHDITELLEQRENLLHIIGEDTLTGVGNRYKINNEVKEHKVNNIAVIDIDGFSFINDFYGNNIGDQVITGFARLLINHLPNEFLLYRLHSDKFAILNYTLSTERFTNFITHLNTTMIESTVMTTVKEFDIITTTGISSEDNENILLTAEIANKYAKKINQKVLVYSSALNIEAKFAENIEWNEKIKLALKEDRIVVVYQPIYNNVTNQIEKYECLVRLKDKNEELISPYFFLENAKATGQYIDISKAVVAQAFKMFSESNMEFSINLTIQDIQDKEFIEYFDDMLDKYNVSNRLVLEIVESEEIENFKEISKFTQRMKSIGCKIAIDDFGTGYSNFEYLAKLDVDYVKIDGSLIKDINEDKNIKKVVNTIVDFAKEIKCKTIAEYVSSPEILEVIRELKIDYSQGYYIGAPHEELQNSI